MKKYRVIGFNDEVKKFAGPAQRFRLDHQFFCDELPSQEQLLTYATVLGYAPRKGRGIHPARCEPVYFYTAEQSPGSVYAL